MFSCRIVLVLFLVQMYLTFTSAQITFTREWVTGKRSGIGNPLLSHKSNCVSFLPTIEFLMEIEDIQKRDCGLSLKPWKAGEGGDDLRVTKIDGPYEPRSLFPGKA